MKKVFTILLTLFILFTIVTPSTAADVSVLQFMYLVKQVFPDMDKVSLMVNAQDLDKKMKTIERASAMYQVQISVQKVANSSDIGNAIANMEKNSTLVIMDDKLFDDMKSKFYILSKCKAKQISLVTSSPSFFDSGALLGFFPSEENMDIKVNLKHYDHLKNIFTSELIEKVGITEVIS